MGLFKGALKAGLAATAVQIVRRQAAKPENQRRAKQLFNRLVRRTGK